MFKKCSGSSVDFLLQQNWEAPYSKDGSQEGSPTNINSKEILVEKKKKNHLN